MQIARVLTDNGREALDRLLGLRKRAPTDKHDFARLCADLGCEHRLASYMRPLIPTASAGDSRGIPLRPSL